MFESEILKIDYKYLNWIVWSDQNILYVLKKFEEGKQVCIFFFNKFRYWWIFLWNHVWKIRFIVKFGSIFKSDCCFLYEGNVGPPLPCCEIKLADVEDMNYYAKDNKGEVSHLMQILSLIILKLSVMDSCDLFCINDYSHVKTKKIINYWNISPLLHINVYFWCFFIWQITYKDYIPYKIENQNHQSRAKFFDRN